MYTAPRLAQTSTQQDSPSSLSDTRDHRAQDLSKHSTLPVATCFEIFASNLILLRKLLRPTWLHISDIWSRPILRSFRLLIAIRT
jgi:hypothetical protein